MIAITLTALGFSAFSAALITFMIRATGRERESMQRIRQAWIDDGADPDHRPNFYTGNQGG